MQSWKIEKFSEPGGTTDLPTVTKVTKRVMTDLTIMILFLMLCRITSQHLILAAR
jgi:hypothetical protein